MLATLYAAKKYIVPHLARACVNYLETSLTAKNACLLLSQSRLFEEPELMQRCWEVIDAQVSGQVVGVGGHRVLEMDVASRRLCVRDETIDEDLLVVVVSIDERESDGDEDAEEAETVM